LAVCQLASRGAKCNSHHDRYNDAGFHVIFSA
jgi:hypothetical protein